MSTQISDWPPAYTIRRHWRAKYVKMSYSRSSGLEITLPKRISAKHIPAILEENKEWILKQKLLYDHAQVVVRPLEIDFLAFQQKWTVHYFQNDKRAKIRQFADGIILSGDIQDFNVCRDKLNHWVRKQAIILLGSYFKNLAETIGIPYNDLSLRSQSTLWGSCSQDKSIRLNYKLIFLPEPLMRHIMIHELCHTRHMNHSDKFWNLVAKFDTNWQEHKKAMRNAEHFIPAWL
jgi:predicted metal-dependent hydrolase